MRLAYWCFLATALSGGADAPAGSYLYVLHAGDQHEMGKLVRVR